MLEGLPAGIELLVGAVLVPLFRGHLRSVFMLALPVLGLWRLLGVEHGLYGQVQLFEFTLVLFRVDALALVFGYVFYLAAFLAIVYSLHVRDLVQQIATLVYAAAAIAAVFAGDLVTLFVLWELTAIASVFLIWARRTERAYRAGMRYLVIQVGSGVILLAGIAILVGSGGSTAFEFIGIDSLAGKLIFLAFGIKAAFPLLHNWLQDAYPEATETGTVVLSAFTTKLAIYALARGYPGTEILIWIGATMTAFPVFFAVIENDLRRVLSYSLNNQLGYMVVGIGIGTELSLNGTAAHAFAHILYKALLFMSMGAVLYRTGTVKASELGGLYKSMPWTTGFCIVGALSISAFPLLSGFVTKSMIMTAAADEGYFAVFMVLLFASAGVMEHSGIKIPYFAFFGHDSGRRVKEAPWNMLLAMGLTAFLCIAIGVYPYPLYAILPFPVTYEPFTATHVVTMLQLLMFSVLAFAVLVRTGLYPPETPSVNLDFDVVYRRLLPALASGVRRASASAGAALSQAGGSLLSFLLDRVLHYHGPRGVLARTWAVGSAAIWVMALLGIYMLLYFF